MPKLTTSGSWSSKVGNRPLSSLIISHYLFMAVLNVFHTFWGLFGTLWLLKYVEFTRWLVSLVNYHSAVSYELSFSTLPWIFHCCLATCGPSMVQWSSLPYALTTEHAMISWLTYTHTGSRFGFTSISSTSPLKDGLPHSLLLLSPIAPAASRLAGLWLSVANMPKWFSLACWVCNIICH